MNVLQMNRKALACEPCHHLQRIKPRDVIRSTFEGTYSNMLLILNKDEVG